MRGGEQRRVKTALPREDRQDEDRGGESMKPNIVLGLSGGVDSAVAACLLMEDYTVIGVYLSIGSEGAYGEADARRVA